MTCAEKFLIMVDRSDNGDRNVADAAYRSTQHGKGSYVIDTVEKETYQVTFNDFSAVQWRLPRTVVEARVALAHNTTKVWSLWSVY